MQVDRAGGSATVSVSVFPGTYSSNRDSVCQGCAIPSLSDSKSFCGTSWTEACGWVADIRQVSNHVIEQEVKVMPWCQGTTSLSTSTAIFAGSSGDVAVESWQLSFYGIQSWEGSSPCCL